MILTEQKYKKLNKNYYHGQECLNRDPTVSKFNCFYLSTDPYYSFQYAKQNGYIKVYHLKQELNICNLKSKKDTLMLEKYIRKYKPENSSKIIRALSDRDWFDIFKKNYRENFINFLKTLDYDGFFNIECNDPENGRLAREDDSKGFPSIGIFDTKNLICIKTYHSLEEFTKIDRLEDIRKKEISFLKKQFYKVWKKFGRLIEVEVRNILRNFESEDRVRLINNKDVLDILNNFDPKEIEKTLEESCIVRKQRIKNWWGYEPSRREIQDYYKNNLSIINFNYTKGEFTINDD